MKTTIQEILDSRIPDNTCNYDEDLYGTPYMPDALFRALVWHDHEPFNGHEEFEDIRKRYSKERLWVVYATRYRLKDRHVRSIGKMYPKIKGLIAWVTRCHTHHMLWEPPVYEYPIDSHWDTDRETSYEYEARMEEARKERAEWYKRELEQKKCKYQSYIRFISQENLEWMIKFSEAIIPNYNVSCWFLLRIVRYNFWHGDKIHHTIYDVCECEDYDPKNKRCHHIIRIVYKNDKDHTYTIRKG